LTDHDPKTYVAHVLSEIEFLESKASGRSYLEFKNDATDFRAAAYSVQIISEATRNIPNDWLEEFPDINWHGIKAIGNHTRHEYASLRSLTIWEIMTTYLVDLKLAIQAMMLK
jgi:uncharacterized protein with HEPN domain